VFALRGKTRLLPNVAVGAAAIASLYLSGCTRTSTIELPLQQVFAQQIDIPPGASASVSTKLDAGTYSIVVSELGVDVATNVTANGATVALNDLAPRHGVQIAVVTVPASEPSVVSIHAQSTDHRTKKGSASVEIQRWPSTLSKELRSALQGERAFMRAFSLIDDTGDWKKVATAFSAAAEQYAHGRFDARTGLAKYCEAIALYYRAGDWSGGESAASAAEALFADIDDAVFAARAQVLSAAARLEQANEMASLQEQNARSALFDQADSAIAKSAVFFEKNSFVIDAAAANNFRGLGKWYLRDYAAARTYFIRAAESARASSDQAMEANILGNLAWLDFATGRTRQAAEEYARLLAVLESDNQLANYAAHASNFALVLVTLGNFDKATALHTALLDAATASGDNEMRTRQLVALGALALQQGDAQHALEFATAALARPSELKSRGQYNAALRLAGNAAKELGDIPAARQFFTQFLDRATSPTDVARSRIFLAATYRMERNFKEAARQIEAGLELDDDWVRAEGLVERAKLRASLGEVKGAIADLRLADRLYMELGLDAPRILAGALLSDSLLRVGDASGARAAADSAIALARELRSHSSSPEVRARFLASRYAPFEAKIAAILVTPPSDQSNSVWEALDTAEAVRSLGMRELLGDSGRRSESASSDTSRLRDALTTQQMLLERRLQRTAATDKAVSELRRDIAETRARLAAIKPLPGLASFSPPIDARGITTAKESQRTIPAGHSVAYFFVGANRSEFWQLTATTVVHRSLPGRDQLEKSIRSFLVAAGRGGPLRPDPTLLEIGNLIGEAPGSSVTIVPDGPLNTLPFAALPIRSTGNSLAPLVTRKVIAFAPSLAVLAQQHHSRASERGMVAIVSDPVYARDDQRLAALGINSTTATLRGEESSDFLRLPYSGAEAREVSRQFEDRRRIELTGLDATSQAVSALPFDKLDVLHIATHARGREDDPGLSAVYLSAFDARGAPATDMQLTARRILESGMRANLVVLSGCDTAGGVSLAGEGFLGLAHSFLANGSDAVVASLWAVEDSETARLITDFYSAYRAGSSAADALALAQRAAIVRAPNSMNWASFVVRGNSFGSDRKTEERI
jgi:CHAT domain-containing protein/tetratricopeptide (TPR) repeat protein